MELSSQPKRPDSDLSSDKFGGVVGAWSDGGWGSNEYGGEVWVFDLFGLWILVCHCSHFEQPNMMKIVFRQYDRSCWKIFWICAFKCFRGEQGQFWRKFVPCRLILIWNFFFVR